MKKLLVTLSAFGVLLLLDGCGCKEMCDKNQNKAATYGLHKKELRDERELKASTKKDVEKKKTPSKKKSAVPKKEKVQKQVYSKDLLERAPWADYSKET